jgi:hypothetical protein
MLDISFDEFQRGTYKDGDYGLYVLSDGAVMLYIGISESNVWNRWFSSRNSHMIKMANGRWIGNSSISQYVIAHMPESKDYRIRLYTLEDLRSLWADEIIKRHVVPTRTDFRDFEALMIKRFQPLYNASLNQWE